MSKLWEIKISAILGWYSWNCPSAVGCFGWADAAPTWGTLWACKILDWPRTCVQVLLGALVELMLHQPGKHCGNARFWIGRELVPITGQNVSKLWKIKISAILGWYSWNCPSAVGKNLTCLRKIICIWWWPSVWIYFDFFRHFSLCSYHIHKDK